VFLTIHGARHDLWRAVDQDDHVLDILVQSRRNKQAAKKFFRTLLKGLTHVPRVIITDQLQSYGAAKREIVPGVEHRQSRYLNNRCEHSHWPTRQRERRMQGFTSPGHAQRFLSVYDPITQHFRPRRHLLSAANYHQEGRVSDLHFPTWHCQLNVKNLYISAAIRKLYLVFFFYDRLSFRHLYIVSFPHEEGLCERFFIPTKYSPLCRRTTSSQAVFHGFKLLRRPSCSALRVRHGRLVTTLHAPK
jgi:DDE domain